MEQKKKLIAVGCIVFLLLGITFVLVSNYEAPVETAKISEPPSPWQATTVPYGSECVGECLKNIEPIAEIETAHLRGIKITVRPDINDAIAQLGDCLDTIMDCVDEKGDAKLTAPCVAQSQCPASCKEAYAKRFNSSMPAKVQLDGIETIFLTEHAVCAPREAIARE